MSAPSDGLRDRQLVTLARELERLMAKRRKIAAEWVRVDDAIRVRRKLISDLTTPIDHTGLNVGELLTRPDGHVDA